MKKLIQIAFVLIVVQLAGNVLAQQEAAPVAEKHYQWRLLFSPYTYHYTYDPEHKDVVMIGLEHEFPDASLDGLSLFKNSFGQDSAFIYPWGHIYRGIGGINPLSFKWTAGLLYGYVEPYENKVPLNYKGFSPGVIFGLAYEFRPGWSAQLNFLGTAAVMFQISVPLN
ncbi:MAG: hypothetical protein V4713_04125 [Pseudomonadota bacterium]